MPHAYHLHHDILARRDRGRAPHGLAPRCLLPWLLLASLRHPVSARHHEYRGHGSYHSHHIRRENAALASSRALRRGFRAYALWCISDCDTPTPSYFPERCRHGYAPRNADEDAREWQHTCHEVVDPIVDVGSSNAAFGPKQTSVVAPHMSAFGDKANMFSISP